MLTQDLVIDTNGVLTIEPGITVYVYPDIDDNNQGYSDSTIEIITKGKLYANGTFSDSIRFIPFTDSAAVGDWVGIYLDEHAVAEFEYCSVQYGDRAIELRTDAEAKISHCNIGNCFEIGVYNYKGYLDLDNSNIAYNGLYGLYGYMAADSVYNTRFIDNVQYGIKIFGINLAHDSTYIICDTMTCFPGDAQYGIYVESNDYIMIRRCKVSSYDMGGIYLKYSDAIIDSSDFSGNVNYGLCAENGSFPKVRRCVFNSLSTGVRALSGSKPDLGKSTTGNWGYSSFDTSLTYYVYFTNDAFLGPDTLWAQYNWWGISRPSPAKFYTDYSARKIIWSPYLSSPPKLEIEELIPLTFSLSQNYPNPFNPATTISFTLEEPAHTVISIFNIMGQKIVTLVDEDKAAGEHSVVWDGRNGAGTPVSSGVYFYAIQSGDRFESKKMILLR